MPAVASFYALCMQPIVGSRFLFGYFWVFFGFFWGIFWFYVRGCCKNCKSHKDETNAEATISLFWVFFWVLPSWVMQTVQ